MDCHEYDRVAREHLRTAQDALRPDQPELHIAAAQVAALIAIAEQLSYIADHFRQPPQYRR